MYVFLLYFFYFYTFSIVALRSFWPRKYLSNLILSITSHLTTLSHSRLTRFSPLCSNFTFFFYFSFLLATMETFSLTFFLFLNLFFTSIWNLTPTPSPSFSMLISNALERKERQKSKKRYFESWNLFLQKNASWILLQYLERGKNKSQEHRRHKKQVFVSNSLSTKHVLQ